MNDYGYSNIRKWESAEEAFAKQFNLYRTDAENDQYNDIDVYDRVFNKETKQWGKGTTYSIKNQMKGCAVFGNITFEMTQTDTRTGETKPGCIGYSKADKFAYKIQFPEAKHLPEKYAHFAKKKFWLIINAPYLREFLADKGNIESETTTKPNVEADNRKQGRKYDRSTVYRVNVAKLLLAQNGSRENIRLVEYIVPKK